jgi:hypothetical protein
MLSTGVGLCYNRRAVKHTGKQVMAPAKPRAEAVVESASNSHMADKTSAEGTEQASNYCPVCSERLESRRCKLICNVCGYYMSCADYY